MLAMAAPAAAWMAMAVPASPMAVPASPLPVRGRRSLRCEAEPGGLEGKWTPYEVELELSDLWSLSKTLRMGRWAKMSPCERLKDWAGACNLSPGTYLHAHCIMSLSELLDKQGIRSALAGSVAASVYGIPRMCHVSCMLLDVDAAALEQLLCEHPDELKWIRMPSDQVNRPVVMHPVGIGHKKLVLPPPSPPLVPILEARIGVHCEDHWIALDVCLNTWWGADYALNNALQVELEGQDLRVIPVESFCFYDVIKGHPEAFELVEVLCFQDKEFIHTSVARDVENLFGARDVRVSWWHEQVARFKQLEPPKYASVRDMPWKDGRCPVTDEGLKFYGME